MVSSFAQLYWVQPGDPYRYEVSFIWMPALLALVSFASPVQARLLTVNGTRQSAGAK